MRSVIVLFIGLVLAPRVIAQKPESISGEWLVTRDVYGSPLYQRMTLTLQDGKLTGVFAGDKLEGTLNGNALHFLPATKTTTLRNSLVCSMVQPSPARLRKSMPGIQRKNLKIE